MPRPRWGDELPTDPAIPSAIARAAIMSGRKVVACPFASLGVDTATRPTREQYAALAALGVRWVARYLGDLTSAEIGDAHAAGLGVVAVQHAHAPGWQPLVTLGDADGRRAVNDARAAGIPPMTLWCDLEGLAPTADVQAVQVYAVAWCNAVRASGFEAGVYLGEGVPGTAQSYYALPFVAYWKSQSMVATPARRGWQLIQLYNWPRGECRVGDVFPGAPASVAALLVDFDVAGSDYLGGFPTMLVAG
jgi:hypothetical protein